MNLRLLLHELFQKGQVGECKKKVNLDRYLMIYTYIYIYICMIYIYIYMIIYIYILHYMICMYYIRLHRFYVCFSHVRGPSVCRKVAPTVRRLVQVQGRGASCSRCYFPQWMKAPNTETSLGQDGFTALARCDPSVKARNISIHIIHSSLAC